jgi:site-specific DNA recombinase
MHKLAARLTPGNADDPIISRLADLQGRLVQVAKRAVGVREQIEAIRKECVDEEEVSETLRVFDPVWEALAPREQARVMQLLVERIDYDGAADKIAIHFHPTAIKALAGELARHEQEQTA